MKVSDVIQLGPYDNDLRYVVRETYDKAKMS